MNINDSSGYKIQKPVQEAVGDIIKSKILKIRNAPTPHLVSFNQSVNPRLETRLRDIVLSESVLKFHEIEM